MEQDDKFYNQVASAAGLVTGKTYKPDEIETLALVIDRIREKGGAFSLDDASEIKASIEKKANLKAVKETKKQEKDATSPRKKYTPVNDLEKRVMKVSNG